MKTPLALSQPVFIVGMNGSGTTMLLDCLDNHPHLFGFKRETKILPYFINTSSKHSDLSIDKNFRKLWLNYLNFSFFKYVNNGEQVPLPKNWKDAPRSAAGIIDQTFLYFAQQENKMRWCEKTPMHAQHINLLAKTFPDAKFLHVIRDGRACASSFHRRWNYKPELTVYRWKHIVEDARRQGKHLPGRYFEIRYEDLTDDPDTWLRKICEFLEVPPDSNIINLSRVRKHSGSSDTKITQRTDYWHEYFSEEVVSHLNKIAGKTLYSLNYSTNNPDSNEDPATFLIKYWMYKDNIRQGLQALYNELTRKNDNGKWDDLTGRIINAIRQRLTNRL